MFFLNLWLKSIAEKNGLRATFMPKPFENLTGNGCHALIFLCGMEVKIYF